MLEINLMLAGENSMKPNNDRRLMLMFFHYIVSLVAFGFIFIYRAELQEYGTFWLYLLITFLLLALAIFETYRYRKGKQS